MTRQRIPRRPEVITRLRRHATGTEQLNAGHFQAHAAVAGGKCGADFAGQSGSQNIGLRQAWRDQSPRLAVNFAAFANGTDAGM
ncbi:hypothetical protein D3C80_2014180 [compost metagenome]